MADSNFKAGDVVTLKSGGPKMTVAKITPQNDGTIVIKCTWSVSPYEKVNEHPFTQDALEIAKP